MQEPAFIAELISNQTKLFLLKNPLLYEKSEQVIYEV